MSMLELCMWSANRRLPEDYRTAIEEWGRLLEENARAEWGRVAEGYIPLDRHHIEEQVMRPLTCAVALLHDALECTELLQQEEQHVHDIS